MEAIGNTDIECDIFVNGVQVNKFSLSRSGQFD